MEDPTDFSHIFSTNRAKDIPVKDCKAMLSYAAFQDQVVNGVGFSACLRGCLLQHVR